MFWLSKWFLRKSNIGNVARSVATAWKSLSKENMTPYQMAGSIIRVRYMFTNEQALYNTAINKMDSLYGPKQSKTIFSELVGYREIAPIDLAWLLLVNENKSEELHLIEKEADWKPIMQEEIDKIL